LFGGSSSDLELDYDEDEELLVDDEDEDLPPTASPLAGEGEDELLSVDGEEDGLYDDEFDEFSGINKKLTTRQIAMQTGTAGALLSLPMPDKRSSGKVNTEEARLKKVSQAERRKRKQEIDQKQQKETVINQLLNRSAKPKKDDVNPKVVPKSIIPQITYISGLKGNALIFPENQPIPEFLVQKAPAVVPTATKCAAPKCTNAKRYNDSRTQLPLCSLECYKIVHSSVSTAVGTAK